MIEEKLFRKSSIEFQGPTLPKSDVGKILKRGPREPYWIGKSRKVN